jgi:protein-S-isoprenylcysteine O-methyltransferase Ste14
MSVDGLSVTVSGPLAISVYFLIFALVHSLLADPAFKSRARANIGPVFDRWQRLAYNLLALIMILPFLFILALLPGRTLYEISAPWIFIVVMGQLLLAAAMLMTLRQTGAASFLGLSQIWNKGKTGDGSGLVTTGFYHRTRNPLFLFAALILWLTSIMTSSLLAFNILASVYFYLGARHEERSLKAEYGAAYEAYKRRVPMFMPRLRSAGR